MKEPINIKDINGIYQSYEVSFEQYDSKITALKQIKIGEFTYNYYGMVDKENKPHGFGRAISIN